jgi:bifunctional non-homologous end joining protein LigD
VSPRTSRTLPLVEPILLTLRREPFDDPAWVFEPKYDGYRGLLYVTPQGCHFRSKRGNILKRFEQLCYWVREELPVKEAILDGEVVALDSEGRQNFRDLTAGRGNLHYAAFDALWVRGRDLRDLPLTRRKRALTGLIPAATTVLSQVFSIEGRGRDLFDAAERLDLEGNRGQAEGRCLPSGDRLVQNQEPDLHAGRGQVGAVPEAAILSHA